MHDFYKEVSLHDIGDIDRVNSLAYDHLATEYDSPSHETTRLLEIASLEGFSWFCQLPGLNFDQPILEIGSGTGNLTSQLLKFTGVTAIDISKRMLKVAKQKLTTLDNKNKEILEFEQISILVPPSGFFSRKFGVVVCGLGDPFLIPEAIRNIAKLVTKQGFVFISLPEYEWARKERIDRLRIPFDKTRFRLTSGKIVTPYSFTYPQSEISEILMSSNLKPIQTWEITAKKADQDRDYFLDKPIVNIPTVLCVIGQNTS